MARLKFERDSAIQSGSLSSTTGGFAGIVGDCPEDVGEECDPGTGNKAARCDHVHAHGLRDESGHNISRLRRLLTNNSGGDLTAGAVVVLDDTGFDTTSTAASSVGMVGILLDDTTDGADGYVQFISPQSSGTIPAGVTGASAGDYLFTSSTPGEATADATRAAGAFGRVLAVDGSGVPEMVELWGVPDGSGGSGGLDSVTDGTTTVTSVTDIAFAGDDFDVTDGGSGEADVAIAAPTAISPSQLTANTDDWAPTGLSGADIIRASTDASRNLTGITAPAAARSIILENIGSNDLVLVHDATSTAANRFLCPGSADLTVGANTSVLLTYDTTSARWRVVGGAGTAAGASALDDLTDVSLSTPAANEVLAYNGSNWANIDPSGIGHYEIADGGGDRRSIAELRR